VWANAKPIPGREGQIRWAYYVAAGVEGWSLMPLTAGMKPGAKPKWSLTARIVGRDPFKMAQRPLLFVTHFGRGRSVWQIEQFRLEGDRLTATLGPREDY
jgi:hypothetical protein